MTGEQHLLHQRARSLRRNQTPEELALWRCLKGRSTDNLKFRRQHPLGWYIADFYCPSAMLVIEIDGDSHADQVEYDNERTAWLESQGIRVIRFSNQEITGNIDSVLEKIVERCQRAE